MVTNKPTIYNAPTVYKMGGNGGEISELPDISVNGKIFKNFFPYSTYVDRDNIDSNFVLRNYCTAANPIILFGGSNFQLAENDTFDIQFCVSRPSFSTNYSSVFGSMSYWYDNISMDFGQVTGTIKKLFVGIPRSTSPNTWTDPIIIDDIKVSENIFYKIKVVCNDTNITLSITDDESTKSVSTNKNNLNADSILQLMGLNRNESKKFNGLIDLKSTYIKKNGYLVWGMEE